MPHEVTAQSDSTPHNCSQTHLIAFFHGLHGRADDFAYFVSQLNSDPSIDSLIIRSNEKSYSSTLDGIDRGGLRAADEIERHIEQRRKHDEPTTLTHISLVGHSLGGLYARYTAHVLHRRGLFERIKPALFITFGTPHCGSLQHFKLFAPFGIPTAVLSTIFTTAIGRTGHQLTFTDKDSIEDDTNNDETTHDNDERDGDGDGDGPSDEHKVGEHVPLLVRMSHPHFTKSLLIFDRRVLYANINGDFSVHFCTAAITHANPFKSLPTKLIPRLTECPAIIDQPKFEEIQQSDENNKSAANGKAKVELFASLSSQPAGEYLRQILRQFESVPFERYYIVGRSLLAHTDMIVKWKWFSNTGKPIVQHCINILHQTMDKHNKSDRQDLTRDKLASTAGAEEKEVIVTDNTSVMTLRRVEEEKEAT